MKPIRFATIGINHDHIYGQTNCLLNAGAEFAGFYAVEDDLSKAYGDTFPSAPRVDDKRRFLEDDSIDLIVTAAIPGDRSAIAIEAMRAGKDVMTDKPGMISLEQLAEVKKVQAETGRIFSVMYSEHFETRSTIKAGELVAAGAIGKVVSTVGLGPHRPGQIGDTQWICNRPWGSHACRSGSCGT